MNEQLNQTKNCEVSEVDCQRLSAKSLIPESERQRCEIWTRVMGYHRPVSSFNIGKKGEFYERVYFRES